MPDDPNPPPPDGVEPDSSSPAGIAFTFVIGSEAFDFVLRRHGLQPTKEIRLTMVQELYASAPAWIDATIASAAAKVASNN